MSGLRTFEESLINRNVSIVKWRDEIYPKATPMVLPRSQHESLQRNSSIFQSAQGQV